MSGKIRIKYSGLIVFSSKIFSVFTGLIFVALVTRNLSVNEFGIWQYLTLILSYVVFPSALIPYWVTRFYARGSPVAKASIISNMIVSLPFFTIFLISAPLASTIIKTNLSLFYLISIQIFLVYLSTSLEALALAKKPHLLGYETIAFESAKIALALILFTILKLGLKGAIATIILAYLTQCLTLTFFLRRELIKEKGFDWRILRKWFSNIWLPLFNAFPTFIGSLDLFVLAALTKSAFSLAFYKVASSVATVISYSSTTTIALYPNLLKGGEKKDVEETLKFFLMFAVPMSFGAIFLAKPILHIFKPEYEAAALLLIFMAPQYFLKSLTHIFGNVIIGVERVDEKEASLKDILKSRLFKWPLLNYFRNGVAIILTYILVFFALNHFSSSLPLYAAFSCLLANIAADIFLFIKAYSNAVKAASFNFPLNKLLKCCSASIIMIIPLKVLNPVKSLETIFAIAVGSIIYFLCLFLIDFESKTLFKKIFTYVKKFNLWE
ncbi:hypothetical protein KEJ50_05340 [Candidatus Bathyarchaeota archaeon]|nr:hypothetical protein [Candidatus Bathyarchaeota archaeon]